MKLLAKNITTRQLIIFYCIYSFSIKFLSLPSLLSKTAGRDAWIAALIGITLELVVLFLTITYISKKQQTTIYQDIRQKNIIFYALAKVVMIVFFAVFAYQLVILVNQTYKLLDNNLFENLSPYLFYIPMILLGVFFCIEPSKAIFRSGEIFFVLIFLGVALSVFPVLHKIDPREALPIMQSGFWPVMKATLVNIIFFESVLFLLMFKGEIEIKPNFKKKFMSTALVVNLFFVFFVFLFISLFGALAPFKDVAITNLTVHSSYITNSGRLDWVLVTMWLLLILLRFGITFYCAFKCVRHIIKGVGSA